MEITTGFSDDGKILTIYIEGDFNFQLLHEFKDSYSNINNIADKKIVIDMRKTLTIDSSALGMLLNMKKELHKKDGDIYIENCNDVVSKILRITNFEKLFNIEP